MKMLGVRKRGSTAERIPPQKQHHDPELPRADSSEPYVTWSGRRVVKPKRLDLWNKLGTKNHFLSADFILFLLFSKSRMEFPRFSFLFSPTIDISDKN